MLLLVTLVTNSSLLLSAEKNSLGDGRGKDETRAEAVLHPREHEKRKKLFPGFENLQQRFLSLRTNTQSETPSQEVKPAQKLVPRAAIVTEDDKNTVEVVEYRQGWLMPDHEDKHQP